MRQALVRPKSERTWLKISPNLERLTKSSVQSAVSHRRTAKTVHLYGETLQRSNDGFVRRS